MSMVATAKKPELLPSKLGLPVHVKSPRERARYADWTANYPELFSGNGEKKKEAAPESEARQAELAKKRKELLGRLFLAEGIICEALIITENHLDAWQLYEELCAINRAKEELDVKSNGMFKALPLVEQRINALVCAEEKNWP